MNISKVNITIELDESEIFEILFPMKHELERSAEHYINHYQGSLDGFIECVRKENTKLVNIFDSLSNVLNRPDLMRGVEYEFKRIYEAKKEGSK